MKIDEVLSVMQAFQDKTKPWWQSRTIMAAGAGILISVASTYWHVDVSGSKDQIVDVMIGLGGTAAGVMAILGRLRAQHVLTAKKPEDAGR